MGIEMDMKETDKTFAEIIGPLKGGVEKVGKVLLHPDGRTVKIKSGYFLDSIYGRISNFWYWNEVLENGSLGPEEHGYGW